MHGFIYFFTVCLGNGSTRIHTAKYNAATQLGELNVVLARLYIMSCKEFVL